MATSSNVTHPSLTQTSPEPAARGLRILLLILQFPPDVNSTGLLMAQVAEGLQERGHDVTVVTTFPHYSRFRVWDEFRGKLAQWGTYKGMDVLRLYVHATGAKQNMVNRLLSYVSFNVLATLYGLLARRKHDVIFCTNGGFFSGITASAIGMGRRVPFVLNVQDLYPETPLKTGQLKDGRAVRVLEALETYMYRKAAQISVITPAFRSSLLAKNVPDRRISIVPNFVDTSFIRPLPKENSFSIEHGLVDKFVVSHAGNVGYVYDLATLLDAAALLRDELDVRFLIVGEGVAKDGLVAQAHRLGLSNVVFLPFQPLETLPWLRATSDVQVSLNKFGAAFHSMPSKIYEIMASGRPLLLSADPGSDSWRLVEETGCGICVKPEDAKGLAEAVMRLKAHPEERLAMGQRGRAAAENTYSTQAVVTQYDKLLHNTVDQHRRKGTPQNARRSRSAR